MKRILLLLPMLSGLYISSIAQRPAADYALYIPTKGNSTAMPVVFFFDPHGNGSLPLNKYQTLGEAYGFILVGSHLSKNGNDWPTTEKIWNQLYSEIRQRVKIDEHRIYTCGFSGGAKVASYIAIQHPGIRGVIAGGAGLPDGVSAGDLPFSFTALAGEGDMNLTELVGISAALDRTQTRHRIIVFDGKHEWAPVAVMGEAFAGWQLEAMHDGVLARDAAFIARTVAGDKSRVEAEIHSGQLIRAEQACRVATSFLDGLTPEAAWFKEKTNTLDRDPKFQAQMQERQSIFGEEVKVKTGYMQHFEQGDMHYWQETIRDLDAKAAVAGPRKGMYQRLLAYLSLAFYSISNQTINAGRNDAARHFVELYKMADPTNSEAWYFSAVLDVREGHTPQAGADLQKAVATGFRDRERMRMQPEFQKAFSAEEMSKIERKIPK